jgi:hypothetical protein
MKILDQYVTSAPSPQAAIDIFDGEWSSKFPAESGLTGGAAELFGDQRINWVEHELGGLEGYKVIELGPLEAGHTYMLEKLGAASVLAVEANIRAYLKCLIVKEIFDLRRSRFLLGDFVSYLRSQQGTFDLCLASGVLYHMTNPVELIQLVSKTSKRVFFWTHYYDEAAFGARPELLMRFSASDAAEFGGFPHTLHQYEYSDALGWSGFCGGTQPHSSWLSRHDFLSALRFFGFSDLRIAFDTPNHPNGPALGVLALK